MSKWILMKYVYAMLHNWEFFKHTINTELFNAIV